MEKRVVLDFRDAFAGPDRCPGCGAVDLVVVVDDDLTVWCCPHCALRFDRIQGRRAPIPPQAGPPPPAAEQGGG